MTLLLLNHYLLLRTYYELGTRLRMLFINLVDSHSNPHVEDTISTLTLQIERQR